MSTTTSRSVWILILVLALALASCGGEPTPTQAPPPTEPAAATEAPTATEAAQASVTKLEDVKSAVIQIEAQGSFVEPGAGLQVNVAGSGSGFIIDPSGLAVTNNHVVTGAAFLKVWVGGESEPRNAKILGVSECSDLAVIDIDGDGFPYLEWYDGPISAGLDIYAAGFPLGDPEYTLTRGIVAKERAVAIAAENQLIKRRAGQWDLHEHAIEPIPANVEPELFEIGWLLERRVALRKK